MRVAACCPAGLGSHRLGVVAGARTREVRRRRRAMPRLGRACGKGGIPSLRRRECLPAAAIASAMQSCAALGQPRRAPSLPRGAVPARQKLRTGGRRARNPLPAGPRSAAGQDPMAKNATCGCPPPRRRGIRPPPPSARDAAVGEPHAAARWGGPQAMPALRPAAVLLPLRAQRTDFMRQPARNSKPAIDHVYDRAGHPPSGQPERGKNPHVV